MKLYRIVIFREFLFFLFLLFLSLSLFLYYFYEIGSSFTHKGVKSFYKKDFVQAHKNFNQALIKDPFNSWPYMNLALSYDSLNAPDKAFKTYNIVSSHLAKKSEGAVFYSYFNKGELYGRLALLEKALANYQQALEFKYKEKTIKKNIELLFQHPPQFENGNKKDEQKEDKSNVGQKENNQAEKNAFDNKQESGDQEGKDESEKEQGGKNQAEEKESGTEQEKKDEPEENKSETGQESKDESEDGKSDTEQGPENQNQENGDSESEKESSPTGDSQNQDQNNSNTQNSKPKPLSKGLNEKEQEAILKEIEKQENEVKLRFYKRKKTYGDKSQKDW